MDYSTIVIERRSTRAYDPNIGIDNDELCSIFTEVALTPSSFNLQHWRFVVIRNTKQKTRLAGACFGQGHIKTASAIVVVCGKLDGHEDGNRIYSSTPSEIRERTVGMLNKFYEDNDQFQRDEAIRSASLASMTLMYSAQNLGYATCPIIGFNSEEVMTLLNIPGNFLPVMLISIGKGLANEFERPYRLPLDEIVKLEDCHGNSLHETN